MERLVADSEPQVWITLRLLLAVDGLDEWNQWIVQAMDVAKLVHGDSMMEYLSQTEQALASMRAADPLLCDSD
eukprot:5841282-Amphidinium_carterae.4